MLVVLEVLVRAHLTVGKRRRGRGIVQHRTALHVVPFPCFLYMHRHYILLLVLSILFE